MVMSNSSADSCRAASLGVAAGFAEDALPPNHLGPDICRASAAASPAPE
jgi:hypothetical protein